MGDELNLPRLKIVRVCFGWSFPGFPGLDLVESPWLRSSASRLAATNSPTLFCFDLFFSFYFLFSSSLKMLRSVHSTPDTPSDHVRHLLDKRRLDIPDDRFSTLSQFSDTPSVYSPAYFSPRDHGPFETASYSSDYRHAGLKDTNISTLDLDDDPRSSISISESYEDDTHSFEEANDDEAEGESRMSYLGPKMRFHSRAPWELEAEGIPEENEELPQSPKHHGFPFSRSGGHKAPNSSGSSSPRPSGDSYRFNLPPKRSFDTINSQLSSKGAL